MASVRGARRSKRRRAEGIRAGAAALAATWAATWATSCGGGDAPGAGEILFDGRPGELVPHAAGDTSRFRIEVRRGDETTSATRSTVVLSEGPAGEFLLETSTDTGSVQRLRARETADDVRIEAIALDEGGGFVWRELEPPAILVRTPVIAGATDEVAFVRTVDLRIESGEGVAQRSLVVTGSSRRRAVGWEDAMLGASVVRALRWEIDGESATEPVVIAGEELSLQVRLRGVEHRAPGLGLVREEADLEISIGAESTLLHLLAERDPEAPAPALAPAEP